MNILYSALNKKVFDSVPASAKTILDVGCGTGVMGKALKKDRKDRIIYGITYSSEEYNKAAETLNKVWVSDINHEIPDMKMEFDCIILSHVLEHTFYPERVLKCFLNLLVDNGTVIIALPNILQYKQRVEFAKGNFRYSPGGGLMDSTHFRFFDWKTAQEMIVNAGLKIVSKEATGNFPLSLLRKVLPKISNKIDHFSLKLWPGLFGFQFVFIAKKSRQFV